MSRTSNLYLAVASAMLLVCQLSVCLIGLKAPLEGRVDFRAYYAAGFIIRTGDAVHLYDYLVEQKVQNKIVGLRSAPLPFLYPAYAALPFVSLSRFSYKSAYFIYFALNLLLLASSAWIMRRHLAALGRLWAPLPWVLFFSFCPVYIALLQGQISFLLLLVYCACFSLLEEEREFAAGLVCAIALLKFQTALPIAVLFIVWRRWRFSAGFALGAAVLASLSLYVTGTGGFASYWQSMVSMTAQTVADAGAAKMRYGMFPTDMPNLHGVLYALAHGRPWGQGATVLCSLALFVWAALQRASLPLAIGVSLMVSYHMPPHDLVLLLLPLGVAINAMLYKAEGEASARKLNEIMDWPESSPPLEKILRWLLVLSMLLLTVFVQPIAMQLGLGYLLCFSVAAITCCIANLSVSNANLKASLGVDLRADPSNDGDHLHQAALSLPAQP